MSDLRETLLTAHLGVDAWGTRLWVQVESYRNTERRKTTDHRLIDAGEGAFLAFTGYGASWDGGRIDTIGNLHERLVQGIAERTGWSRGAIRDLRDVWRTWHATDAVQACDCQDEALGAEQPACPLTGYRYGAAILTRPAPKEVWTTLARLAALPPGDLPEHVTRLTA